MKEYTITQVADQLSLKVHTIRYWEKHVPFLVVKRDHNGKRKYSSNELYVLYRLTFLIRKKGYTLKGAVETLTEEFSSKVGGEARMVFLKLMNTLALQKDTLQDTKNKIGEIKKLLK